RRVEGILWNADAFQRGRRRYTLNGKRVHNRRDLRRRVYPFVRSCLDHERVRQIVRFEPKQHRSGPHQVKLGKKNASSNLLAMDGHTASFGPFRLLAGQRLLLEGDKPVRLGSCAFDILAALIERSGEVVGKEELIV